MEIIPVIDLKADRVVRARMGQRHLYQGIETILSPASDSLSITAGLLSLYPFGTLYVADLDAIEGRGDHRAVLTQLKARHPQLMLWVDNGIANADAAAAWLDTGLGCLVLGSETQRDICVIRDLVAHQRVVLSLDFRGDAFQGPPELLEQPHIWPQRVIVMTLARVGSGAGPDLERLAGIRRAAPAHKLYAAGGVRDRADLIALREAGIDGALIASALHDGRVVANDIAEVQRCTAAG